MQCKHCSIDSIYCNDKFELNENRVKTTIEYLKLLNVKYIIFGGGEPTLINNLSNVFKIARENNIAFSLTTNAYNISSIKLDIYKKSGLEKIIISYDAHDEKLLKLCRNTDELTKIEENIKLILHKGFNVDFNVVIHSINSDFINKIISRIHNKFNKFNIKINLTNLITEKRARINKMKPADEVFLCNTYNSICQKYNDLDIKLNVPDCKNCNNNNIIWIDENFNISPSCKYKYFNFSKRGTDLINYLSQKHGYRNNIDHGLVHAIKVYENCQNIIRSESSCNKYINNIDIFEFSSILHDYHRFKNEKNYNPNDDVIINESRNILNDMGISKLKIEVILDVIKFHENYNVDNKRYNNVDYIKIFQDADRLDALGEFGIIRTFLYGRLKNNEIIDFNDIIKNYDSSKINEPTITHFFTKLFLLHKFMHYQFSKKEAIKRIKTMRNFVKNFLINFLPHNITNYSLINHAVNDKD
jgi:uncharacterized protein